MKKLLTISCVVLSGLLFGQEAQFSQYYAASLYLNPGFNGIYNETSLHLNHKRQIQSAEIVNELTQVSFLFPIKEKGTIDNTIGGFGLMAFNEKGGFRGFYERTSIFLNYAHNLKFGMLDSYLVSVGMQAGYDLRSVNFSNLKWGCNTTLILGLTRRNPFQ